MLDSIYIGMSGLTAHSKGLQTISNNVANLNTPGFKTTTPRFSDLYYGKEHFGEGFDWFHTTTAGSGVDYRYSSLNFKQGEIRNSSGQLDLGIEGRGFLALLDGDKVKYARTGQFAIDDDGSIRDKVHDLHLATIDSSGSLVPVSLDERRISQPLATSRITFTDNLSTGQSEFSIPDVEVYDASGAKIKLKIQLKTDDSLFPGRWRVTVEDANSDTIGEGSLQFLGGIPEHGMDKIEFTITASNGVESKITLDFSSDVSSFSAGTTSTLRVNMVDGHAMGTLSSITVNEEGMLVMTYSNAETAKLGKVAMTDFVDPQRLTPLGNGLFDASQLPPPAYATSKQGVGTLVAGVIEASNVDLSVEFGRLILIQRGFQASSQVVSTANEMLMQLFQMKSAQG